MGKADLHLHTHYSDGACDPETIVSTAKEKGLEAISITDHDSMNAYPEAVKATSKVGIMLLPGAEMTALFRQKDPLTERDTLKEVHLLAYGLDPERKDVQQLMARQKKARKDRIQAILDLLRTRGVALSMEDVLAESFKGNPGRPHIAKALIRNRIASTVSDAFIRYIGNDHIQGIEKNYLSVQEMIQQIHSLGGVAVLAHPGALYSLHELQQLIDMKLDGLETIHPSHPYAIQKQLSELADAHYLLHSGGSDFHGPLKTYEPYFGTVSISMQRLTQLQNAISRQGGVPYL